MTMPKNKTIYSEKIYFDFIKIKKKKEFYHLKMKGDAINSLEPVIPKY